MSKELDPMISERSPRTLEMPARRPGRQVRKLAKLGKMLAKRVYGQAVSDSTRQDAIAKTHEKAGDTGC
jgi:hypothetical protein